MATLLPPFAFNLFRSPLDQEVPIRQTSPNLAPPKIKSSMRTSDKYAVHSLDSQSCDTDGFPDLCATSNENSAPASRPTFRLFNRSVDIISDNKFTKVGSKTQGRIEQTDHILAQPQSRETRSKGGRLAPKPQRQGFDKSSRQPRPHLQNDTPTTAKQKGLTPALASKPLTLPRDCTELEHDMHSVEQFPSLPGTELPPSTAEQGSISREHGRDDMRTIPMARKRFQVEHRQRSSDASSGFVHTIKTASMSNASFSIVSRSLRMGRSSESRGFLRGYSRHSLDSERPVTGSSLDEAALRRGLKRKDIINELILTEESYVADLKALVYLYSTLLAPATTFPNQLRYTIQRNVTELLHLHESLLEELHQTSFKAAARKWAATEAPTRLHRTRRAYSKGSGIFASNGFSAKHSRIRSSIDSAEVNRAHATIGAADPSEILDLANVLKGVVTQLFAYEEYCSNYKTIASELHKHTPSLWSTYQSGMESLNKSIVALDQRKQQDRKGLTVGDLLIKPIQRICRYPLLLQDLLKQTPIVDGPAAHKGLDDTLNRFREVAQGVNLAADNPASRSQMQRKWLLQDRLLLHRDILSHDQYRLLGSLQLCGVLHLTYHNSALAVRGGFVVCALFDNHVLIAMPLMKSSKLELVALISLSDARIDSATAGKGLQCRSTPYTWKVTFTAEDSLHEVLLSACSKTEQEQWIHGLSGKFRPTHFLQITTLFDQSRTFKDMRSLGPTFHLFTPIARSSPKPCTTTIADHSKPCHILLRNTHNPQDLHEWRNRTPLTIDKSRGENNTEARVTLSPKRADRIRLETSIGDCYTGDRLPFPGMIASKSSQIIRASAGTLARKLSFASMHASFSRRSASLSSKRSHHTVHTVPREKQTFSVRKRSLEGHTPKRRGDLNGLPELDTMDSVIERMIGEGTQKKRLSFSYSDKLVRKNTKGARTHHIASCPVGPDDPATLFYKDDSVVEAIEKEIHEATVQEKDGHVEAALSGWRRKRWSNPMAKLRGFGSDGLRNMLYSTS